jgi:acetolactate synthase-1/2/3 large subunit
LSTPKDIIVSDAGSSFYIVGQHWKNKLGQRFISSNCFGTMGWAISAAMGAFIASKKRVLCFTGDGSFQTGLNELSHIVGEQANIKIIVFNNNGYVSIRNTQDTFFDGRHVATDSSNGVGICRLFEIAATYAINYAFVDSYDKLYSIFNTMKDDISPWIIEIATNIHQKIEPTVGNRIDENGKIVSDTLGNMIPKLVGID